MLRCPQCPQWFLSVLPLVLIPVTASFMPQLCFLPGFYVLVQSFVMPPLQSFPCRTACFFSKFWLYFCPIIFPHASVSCCLTKWSVQFNFFVKPNIPEPSTSTWAQKLITKLGYWIQLSAIFTLNPASQHLCFGTCETHFLEL